MHDLQEEVAMHNDEPSSAWLARGWSSSILGWRTASAREHGSSLKAGSRSDRRSGQRMSRPSHAFRFEAIADPSLIEAAWRELEKSAAVTWHQSFDYVKSWCDIAASSGGERPFIVVGYGGDGRIGFIWPFAVHDTLGVKVLRWLGQSHGGYFLGLYRPDVLARIDRIVLTDFVSWLQMREPSIVALHLELQPREFDGIKNPFQTISYCVEGQPAFFVRIERSFTDFCNERFSSKTRRTLRKKRKELLELGATFDFAETAEQGSAIYDTFLRQKRKRLAQLGQKNPFASPRIEMLFRSLIGPARASGAIQNSAIRVNGKTAATCSVVDFKGRLYLLQLSMESGVADRLSPGLLLVEAHMIRHFGSASGVMDFGPGEGSHKSFWKCEQMSRFATLHPVRAWGWPLVLWQLALSTLKKSVKSNLVAKQLRQWRGRGSGAARAAD